MQYFVTFLEGIFTFISPCLLPMLPVYITYFAAGEQKSTKRTVLHALGFVLGFTLVFLAMGALAGTVGSFVKTHGRAVNLITGAIVVLFGLNFVGLLQLNLKSRGGAAPQIMGFGSALLFGMVFSIGWTPCVYAFLGSALMLASQQGSAGQGILLLLCYSVGLGIPFLLSAVLIENLKGVFDAIKRHYTVINRICGGILILVGITMMTGHFGKLLTLLS